MKSGQSVCGDVPKEIAERLKSWFGKPGDNMICFNDGEGDVIVNREAVEALIINHSDKEKLVGFVERSDSVEEVS